MTSDTTPGAPGRRLVATAARGLGVLLLLALFAVQAGRSLRTTSATDDEPYCIVSGLTALRTGDYRFNTDHPPLMSMLLGAAAHLAGAAPLPFNEDWAQGLRMKYSYFYLWRGPNAPRAVALVNAARLPVLALALALGLLVYVWARRLYGWKAGLLALALYATEPNLLAHSSVATLDLGVGAAFCFALYACWRYARTRRPVFLVFTGLALGTAVAMKLPGLLLLLVLPGLLLLDRKEEKPFPSGPVASAVAWVFGLGLFVLWGVYRFSLAPASPESLTPIPLGQYWQAIAFQLGHQGAGHTAYLFGRTSPDGWWYYYPIAFLVKTSLPLLLLLGWALSRGKFGRDELFLALPAGLFFLVSMTQSLNLGIRYLLPIYPLLIILVGRVLTSEPARGRRWAQGLVVALALWAAGEGARYAPNYLAYFNQLAGGPSGGGRVLADSNLDWGQDLPQLAAWQQAHPEARPLHFAYFGPADITRYGVQAERLPDLGPKDPPQPPEWYQTEARPRAGWIAISENCLKLFPGYGWLQAYRPVGRAGYSIVIYHIPTMTESERSLLERQSGLP